MNKRDLIKSIANLTGETQSTVSIMMQALEHVIKQNLSKKEEISMGFLKIKPVRTLGMQGRPTPKSKAVSSKSSVEVFLGKGLRDTVCQDGKI